MKVRWDREVTEYYVMSMVIMILLFGSIYMAGWFTGVQWSDYVVPFSWEMVNVDELKQIIWMK